MSRINSFARDVLFSDRVILLARKKVSMVFFCFSFVAIFMGVSSMGNWAETAGTQLLMSRERYRLYVALQDYRAGRYEETIAACKDVLRVHPNDRIAIHQLAQAYVALQEAHRAKPGAERKGNNEK